MQTRFNFLKSLDLDQDVIRRLSILLSGVVDGNKEIYRTPLAKGEDPSFVLDEWDKVFQSQLQKITSELLELENLNRSKYGPRSIAIPWGDRREGVLQYFETEGDKDCSHLFSANPEIGKISKPGSLRPLSLDRAVDFLKNSTNSGLPYYTRKGKVKGRVLDSFTELLARKDPCIMFTRTQEALKTRTVWGFPIADTLNEMRYYQPLLSHQKKVSWRKAIVSPFEVDLAITKLINGAKSNKQQMVSIDFSAYDTSIKSCLQKECFSYIKRLFQRSCNEEIDYIFERFNTIGLLTPDGVMYGSHGVPSGSTFTNEVDSIAQYLIAVNSRKCDLTTMQIQGDDGVYATANPDELKQAFRDHGLSVNDEKSYISDKYVVYLQNLYSTDYVRNGIISGIYPTYRALSRLIYQERWDDFEEYGLKGSDYYSIRAISILENCRHHPLFEDLVKFVYRLDKFGLQPSQEGIELYVKMQKMKSGTEGIIENQYGDNVSGIRNFETFKVLSKL